MNTTIDYRPEVIELIKFARGTTIFRQKIEEFAKLRGLNADDIANSFVDEDGKKINSFYKKYDLSRMKFSDQEREDLEFLSFIPAEDPYFIPNGNYADLLQVWQSGAFLPTLLTGPTGAGKTKMIEQLHFQLKKPLIRVNITIESDEDSLMGGFRLKNGATYFDKGPVIRAMEMGATLLLDEMDLGSPMKLMCLQSVLENAGYLIKKTGEFVKPAEGFNIIATANTKGGGDESGVYVGTQTLNGAMMDRMTLVFDCEYPTKSFEQKILVRVLEIIDAKLSQEEIELLVSWAHQSRNDKKSDMQLEYSISTRRLVDILKVYKVVGNLDKAIDMCLNRFDGLHKQAFKSFYEALKPKPTKANKAQDDYIVFDEAQSVKF